MTEENNFPNETSESGEELVTENVTIESSGAEFPLTERPTAQYTAETAGRIGQLTAEHQDVAGDVLISIRNLKVHYDLGIDAKKVQVFQKLTFGFIVLAVLVAGSYILLSVLFPLLAGGLNIVFLGVFLVAAAAALIFATLRYFIGKYYKRVVKAVDGISLDIRKSETLGLVGESGCGKSTLGKAILRLTEPTGGQVLYNGKDLAHLSQSGMREQRKHLQMIFQDPYASLNPRMNVGQIISEPIRTFRLSNSARSINGRVQDLMETVGMSRRFIRRYPHEFSGGQRQRIGIARALAVDPEFIVADEPISALDVSIQAQIMNLMEKLQAEKNLTYLFISHDLRAIRHLSDRVAVMYLGRIVELGDAKTVYRDPLMPYTKALISAVPVPDPEIEATRERVILTGDVPSAINPPKGCHFHTRCPYAIAECKQIVPQLVEIKSRHFAACIRISAEKPDIDENVAAGLGALGDW